MTRVVRLEEIDGEIVLRVPADMAARLGFSAGVEVSVQDDDPKLTVERAHGDSARQAELLRRIIEEDDDVLSALAK